MPLFEFEVKRSVIVEADNLGDAEALMQHQSADIKQKYTFENRFVRLIDSEKNLPNGWSVLSEPYGMKEPKSIHAFLKESR